MKYVRRGTPKAPAPAGKAHTIIARKPTQEEFDSQIVHGVIKPQPRDDADQLLTETRTEAIDRRLDAVIDHIVEPDTHGALKRRLKARVDAEKTVKPVKAVKKADTSRESVKKTDTKTPARARSQSKPAKKK